MSETPVLRFKLKKAFIFLGLWVLFFGLSILARLPNFLSKNFFFDGDEAMIGIMAQDLLQGKNFPLYFYGQNYGFSMFEAFSTAFFIKMFGTGIWALRLGGLLIFSLGATFIFKTAQNRNTGIYWSFLIAILVLCFPTWYLWGSMVRGGYVTAFTLCCTLFYLVHGTSFSMRKLIIAGILAAFAFESHLLILIPFSPFILFWIIKREKPVLKMALFLLVFISCVAGIRFIGHTDANWPQPELVFGMKKQLGYFAMQADGLIAGYSNFFFFTMQFRIPAWWNLLLCLSLLLTFVIVVADFVKSGKFRRFYYLFFVLSLLVFCFLISAISSPTPRYWIGCCTGFLFLLAFIFITRPSSRFFRFGLIGLTLIFLAGTANGSKMKSDWTETGVNEQQAFEGLHREVLKYDAKAVFISDNLIQYQWDYLYGKEIPASAFRGEERTNEFNDRAVSIYKSDPSKVVIAGLWGISLQMDTIRGFNESRYQVETKYYINPKADSAFVEQGRRTMRGE